MLDADLLAAAERLGVALRARGETVAVAEGSCGGLISAALLAVPGASAYYAGGAVIYTLAASRAFLSGAVATPPGLRGATEEFASYLARSAAARLGATWGIGEGGAAGPSGNRYGDPAGHAWVAVAGRRGATRHVLTGSSDRLGNMRAFALAAVDLLSEQLDAAGPTPDGPLRTRLRNALTSAMKDRDPTAVEALRSTLGAIDNAEAVAVDLPSSHGGVIAGAVSGLGATEAPRRDLSDDEVGEIVRAVVADWETAAAEYARAGRQEHAAELHAQVTVVTGLLESP